MEKCKRLYAGSLTKANQLCAAGSILFSDTVANNIRFGNNEASLDDVKNAARMAVIDTEIDRFEKQYDTVVGERGVTLSGGQKQRISIARALLKPASLIVLDDCLSAVDASTEQAIQQNLQQYLSDKTAIVITHRIFSLFSFDKIVVIDDGRVVEIGTHEDLLNNNGAYADMYRQQQLHEKSDLIA
jgi:ABC-type bacteriocin/lantibiotic exporters, contain an N-terminal double-glycine peptidase domain